MHDSNVHAAGLSLSGRFGTSGLYPGAFTNFANPTVAGLFAGAGHSLALVSRL
jgi:hypothetical protein